MVRSPEQYLSDMDFTAPASGSAQKIFNASERAFVQKYLGMDAFERLPLIDPGASTPAPPKPVKTLEKPPVLTVAAPRLNVSESGNNSVPEPPSATPDIAAASPAHPQTTGSNAVATVMEATPKPSRVEVRKEQTTPASASTTQEKRDIVKAPAAPVARVETESSVKTDQSAVEPQSKNTVATQAPAKIQTAPTVQPEIAAEPTLRERIRLEAEIQVVSFYVASQQFLLPMSAIQEVLRHMELVKVPQAPDFVAGVINLRGRVTPLVYLSSLLTNARPAYTEKNFIIICGSESLQLGLIIDRISGVHMLPQSKVIWNVEAKLGESADFLMAIANLNDRVCGIVAPEMITQKIMSG